MPLTAQPLQDVRRVSAFVRRRRVEGSQQGFGVPLRERALGPCGDVAEERADRAQVVESERRSEGVDPLAESIDELASPVFLFGKQPGGEQRFEAGFPPGTPVAVNPEQLIDQAAGRPAREPGSLVPGSCLVPVVEQPGQTEGSVVRPLISRSSIQRVEAFQRLLDVG
uniref:Uncharacterized protein n=1 Tax=Thermorudis peleae TaxID=1382356 RepID=A0A831TJ73_9BACT